MNNFETYNYFKYPMQNLNGNLLKGISTYFIESGILSQLSCYWCEDHWINKFARANESSLKESARIGEFNIRIKISDADLAELNSNLPKEKAKMNKEQMNSDKSMRNCNILGKLSKFIA